MDSDQAVKTPDLESLCERLRDTAAMDEMIHCVSWSALKVDFLQSLAAISSLQARITELEGGPANRVGAHLLRRAKEWGWLDDGEGAFEYVSRRSYEQGREDADSRALLAEAQVREAVEVLPGLITLARAYCEDKADRVADIRNGESLLQRLKSPSLEGDFVSSSSLPAHVADATATETSRSTGEGA